MKRSKYKVFLWMVDALYALCQKHKLTQKQICDIVVSNIKMTQKQEENRGNYGQYIRRSIGAH